MKGSAYAEEGARARTATVTEDDDVLRVEEGLRRRVKLERLALLAEALAERILAAVDRLLDRLGEPVVACGHVGVVGERPADRVVE